MQALCARQTVNCLTREHPFLILRVYCLRVLLDLITCMINHICSGLSTTLVRTQNFGDDSALCEFGSYANSDPMDSAKSSFRAPQEHSLSSPHDSYWNTLFKRKLYCLALEAHHDVYSP